MNKRIWSIAVAVAMLLSMLCSVFFVSADASEPIIPEESAPEATDQLNIDASGEDETEPLMGNSLVLTPALAITANQKQVGVGGNVVVDVALKNYAGGWATFGIKLEYPENLQLKSSENKLDLALLGEGVLAEDQPVFNIDEANRTIEAYWLRIDGENIELPEGESAVDLALLQLTFVAESTEEAEANLSACFVESSVAGYPEGEGAASEMILPGEGGYADGEVVLDEPIRIVPAKPNLTMRLVDAKSGEPVTAIARGEQVKAIVTLNDFYSGWMLLTLNCAIDFDVFELKESDIKNLEAFPGEMLYVVRENENALLVSWVNMGDELLKGGAASADILELTLTAKKQAEETEIGCSFMEGGNVSASVNPNEPLTDEHYDQPTEDDVLKVEVSRPTYLTLSTQKTTVRQGQEIIVDVDIHQYTTGWTAISLLADFDTDVFELVKDANGNPLVEVGDAFPDGAMEIIAVDRSGASDGYPLGVTLLSTKGIDVALKNGAKEGTIMKICLKAKADAVLQETQFPISVAFTPGGNVSQAIDPSKPLTDEHYDQPAEDEALIVEVHGIPALSIRRKEGTGAIDQGDSVTFVVSVEKFTDAWNAMSLMVEYNYEVFTMDLDKDGIVDDGLVKDLKPFVDAPDDAVIQPQFMVEYAESSCPLAVCWFNGVPLKMKSTSGDILEFTLIAREGVDLEEALQEVSVGFVPGGNIANGTPAEAEKDYVTESNPVEIEVNEVALVVSVKIEWGSMAFDYSFGTWNNEDYIWEGRGWICEEGSNNITVTNLGATNVSAKFAFSLGEGFDGMSGTFFDGDSALIEGVPVYVPVASDPKIITFQLDGLPSNEDALSETPQAVGAITVTIDIAQEVPIE